MILAQKFKTLAGAQKRCAFENAHRSERYGNASVTYRVVWFLDGRMNWTINGRIPKEAFGTERLYWQISKDRKKAA